MLFWVLGLRQGDTEFMPSNLACEIKETRVVRMGRPANVGLYWLFPDCTVNPVNEFRISNAKGWLKLPNTG